MEEIIYYSDEWMDQCILRLADEIGLAQDMSDELEQAVRCADPIRTSSYHVCLQEVQTLLDSLEQTKKAMENYRDEMNRADASIQASVSEALQAAEKVF